jgi:hypothetical protein
MNTISSYAGRNDLLKEMSFPSYEAYLESDYWLEIRDAAFKINGCVCLLCREPAVALHHTSYEQRVLEGRDLTKLVPVCSTCYERIQYAPNKRKRSFPETQQHFNMLLAGGRKTVRTTSVYEPPNKCVDCGQRPRSGQVRCRGCQRKKDGLVPIRAAHTLPRPGSPDSTEQGIRLTKKMFYAGKSRSGGWNRKQIEALGFVWGSGGSPIGCFVTLKGYALFLSLKEDHLTADHKKKKRTSKRKGKPSVKFSHGELRVQRGRIGKKK